MSQDASGLFKNFVRKNRLFFLPPWLLCVGQGGFFMYCAEVTELMGYGFTAEEAVDVLMNPDEIVEFEDYDDESYD